MGNYTLIIVVCGIGIALCLGYIVYILVKQCKNNHKVEQYEWLDDDTLVVHERK